VEIKGDSRGINLGQCRRQGKHNLSPVIDTLCFLARVSLEINRLERKRTKLRLQGPQGFDFIVINLSVSDIS
jgi:hypothetical protein